MTLDLAMDSCMTPKAKTGKLDFVKLKNFCASKEHQGTEMTI